MNTTTERKSIGLQPVPQPPMPGISDFLRDDELRKVEASENYRSCLLSGRQITRAEFDSWQQLLGLTPTQIAEDSRMAEQFRAAEKSLLPAEQISQLVEAASAAWREFQRVEAEVAEMLKAARFSADSTQAARRGGESANQILHEKMVRLKLSNPRLWPGGLGVAQPTQ